MCVLSRPLSSAYHRTGPRQDPGRINRPLSALQTERGPLSGRPVSGWHNCGVTAQCYRGEHVTYGAAASPLEVYMAEDDQTPGALSLREGWIGSKILCGWWWRAIWELRVRLRRHARRNCSHEMCSFFICMLGICGIYFLVHIFKRDV